MSEPCVADVDSPCYCERCAAYMAASIADALGDPAPSPTYAADMVDAGRGHLLTHAERAWVRR